MFKPTGETKDVTLRGVDKKLYEQFVESARKFGLSTGDAFNNLVFFMIKQPWLMHGPPLPRKERSRSPPPEVIKGLESLVVSKKDLTEAGEDAVFLFKDIGQLIFAKDVDGPTLIKHVKLISRSEVEFRGDVPKIIRLGLVRKKCEYTSPTEEEALKDITIRNVSSSLYDEFLAKAKSEGKTTGEFFSMILANSLPFIEIREAVGPMRKKKILLIVFEDRVQISTEDLEALGDRGVVFYGINELDFAKDLEQELFLNAIIKIIKCEKVILPKTVPRLIVLSRTIDCKNLELHN
ncbi:MAG: hypothetical protein GF308_04005 [Candidatus Heimdallarchaeota archaeon]|nr:hypothetical protein [Candidatus Heimdallarchaeota archaeon]